MKHYAAIMTGIAIAIFFLSCDSKAKTSMSVNDVELLSVDTIAVRNTKPQEEMAGSLTKWPARRFLRAGDLKFKVHSVREATELIEIRTRQMGGFVSSASILSEVNDSSATPINQDSLLQTIHYTVQGALVLRVPDNRLDSLLASVQPLSLFLVHRNVSAEDVSLQLLTNQWSIRRAADGGRKISRDINQQKNKLTETIAAENKIDEQKAAADNASLSDLTLEDAVQYSTVSISIYQDPDIQTSLLFRDKPVAPFELSFWSQLQASVGEGLQVIKYLLIFLTRLWALIAIAVISFFVYRKYFLHPRKLNPWPKGLASTGTANNESSTFE
jgi:hypothetical protein